MHVDVVIPRSVGARVDGRQFLLRACIQVRFDCVGHIQYFQGLFVGHSSNVRDMLATVKGFVTTCYIFFCWLVSVANWRAFGVALPTLQATARKGFRVL